MIEPHQFFGLYANIPIADRDTLIETTDAGRMTANELYRTVSSLDDDIRKLTERRRIYIADAEEFFKEHQA